MKLTIVWIHSSHDDTSRVYPQGHEEDGEHRTEKADQDEMAIDGDGVYKVGRLARWGRRHACVCSIGRRHHHLDGIRTRFLESVFGFLLSAGGERCR